MEELPTGRGWSDAELVLLVQIDKEAGGKLREVCRLAEAYGLHRSRPAIRDQRCRLDLDARSRQRAVEAAHRDTTPEQVGATVPIDLMPGRCPICGGPWRWERDDAGPRVVCWCCAKEIHVELRKVQFGVKKPYGL